MGRLTWLGVASIAALVGCDPLVGGECAEGWVVDGDRCVPDDAHEGSQAGGGQGGDDINLNGGAGGSSSGSGGSGAGGNPGCLQPDVSCGGICVDLSQDISNCGACGVHCATELCVAGECVGDPVGHTVVIGMSFAQSNAASRKILGNAVFRTLHMPLRILAVRQGGAVASDSVAAVISSEATARGRIYSTTTVEPSGLIQQLAGSSHDVVLIEDLAAAGPAALAELGVTHAQALADFRLAGGTVVALATGDACAYLDAAGVMPCEDTVEVTGKTVHNLVATDTVGNGVPSPFLAKTRTVSFDTPLEPGPSVAWVFADAGGEPVVVHWISP